MLRLIKFSILTSIFFALFTAITHAPNVGAVTASDWKAGSIIDEEIFFRPGTMSDTDIQFFLNSKVPTCDTWGQKIYSGSQTRAQYGASRGYPAPFICLRDYTMSYGEKNDPFGYCKYIPASSATASEIINRIANSCGINPQALVVLLEKEQGLVSDDWPWSLQYRGATGYGCPDTAPCEAEYYGFFNQVYNAAWQFRSYTTNPDSFRYKPFVNNSIYWSPNLSCGGGNVYIANRSTAGLYNYTPYQPNSAALNNMYGSGDGCSAYGNRNFWRIFNDWFGRTSGVGDLITDGVTGIYYISSGYKYYVPSMSEVYNLGYNDSDIGRIVKVTQDALNTIPDNSSIRNVSVLVSSPLKGIFLISNGYKYYIPSMELFYSYGFDTADIMQISEESINRFATYPYNLNSITSDARGFTYRVENGERHGIFQPFILSRYPDAPKGSKLSDATLSRVTPGVPIVDGKLYIVGPDKSYLTVGEKWFSILRRNIAICNGASDTVSFNVSQGRPGATVSELTSCFAGNNLGEHYLLDGSVKYKISGNSEISYNQTPNYDHFATMQTVDSKNLFANSDGIYEIHAGKRRHVMSMGYVNSLLGSSLPPVLRTDTIKEIPRGADRYQDGTLVAGKISGIFVIIDDRLRYIGSMDQFYTYGFKTTNIIALSESAILEQTKGPNLPAPKVRDVSGYYIISNGKKIKVHEADLDHFGGSAAFTDLKSNMLPPTLIPDSTRFLTSKTVPGIFYMESGKRRHILSWDKFIQLGGSLDTITTVDPYTLKSFAQGDSI